MQWESIWAVKNGSRLRIDIRIRKTGVKRAITGKSRIGGSVREVDWQVFWKNVGFLLHWCIQVKLNFKLLLIKIIILSKYLHVGMNMNKLFKRHVYQKISLPSAPEIYFESLTMGFILPVRTNKFMVKVCVSDVFRERCVQPSNWLRTRRPIQVWYC